MIPPRLSTVFFIAGEPAVLADVTFTADGVAEDYSGYSFVAQWRPSVLSGSAVQLTVDDSESDVGKLVVSASAGDTGLMAGLGVWALEGSLLGGEPFTFLAGNTVGVGDVTR